MIYLASPYSHPDFEVRHERFVAVRELTIKLLSEGHPVFSPIVYGATMEAQLGTDYLSWKTFNDAMLKRCNQLLVLKLPGWGVSAGVTYEIALARELQMPISFYNPEELYSDAHS